SRISVLSGQRPSTHGSYQLGPAYSRINALRDAPTMHKWFGNHGYTTITGGKVLHSGFKGRLVNDIDIDLGREGYGPQPRNRNLNWGKQGSRLWDWGAYPATDAEMPDHRLATKVSEFLAQDHDKPFFLTAGFYRPHVPLCVPQKWFDLFDAASIELPDAPLEDMVDVPPNVSRIKMAAPKLEEIQRAKKWRSLVHAYLASTSFVDHCVGITLDALDASQYADNTIVVLWSDHGFHLGEKQHIAKRTLWEESTRVPLIFSGPGINAGDCKEAVSLLDIYPTLVQQCGLSANERLEGLSLVSQLRDPKTERAEAAVSFSFQGNFSVRSRRWRYVRYDDGAKELYDHDNDPSEFTNLASDPQYTAVIRKLAKSIPKKNAPEVSGADGVEKLSTNQASTPVKRKNQPSTKSKEQ
ncbi:MAG: sulfatase, partial [Planctomycetota bacterium]